MSESKDRPVFRKVESEVDDEFDFHVEMRARELEARGRTPEEARAEAVRGFGDMQRVRSECASLGRSRERQAGVTAWASAVRQDVRFAVRQLRGAPGFTAAAVLTLALGVGATSAIFSVINAVVLRPYAFDEPERVVTVAEAVGERLGDVSAGNFVDWEAGSGSFEAMAAIRWSSLNLATEAAPERVAGAQVTHGYFDVFGVAPALGRTFRPEEDVPGSSDVVVLSDGLWRARFDADAAIVGREIRLDGRPHVVVGVMPPGFDPFDAGDRLWVPIAFSAERRATHDDHYLTVAGRLADGVTVAQAQADLDPIANRLREAYPVANANRGVRVVPFGEFMVRAGIRKALWILLGAVGFVLLIGCGNVANLLLARATGRRRELSVRSALGAGRGRLAAQLLTESLVLALAAAAAGVALAWIGVRVLVATAPPAAPRLATASVDGTVLLFALGVSVASGLLFGLVPVLRTVRQDVQSGLRDGGRGTVGLGRDRLRGVFVAGEVALAFTLLTGAMLLIRSAREIQREDPGFEPAGVLSGRISLPRTVGPEDARLTFTAVAEQLQRTPRIDASALSSQVPAGPGGGSNGLLPEGRPMQEDQTITARMRIVTPGYFGALGIPLERGRDFTGTDIAGSTRVIVISAGLAAEAWPDEDPIGKRIVCCEPQASMEDPRWKTVIGVAGDVQWRGPGQDFFPEFYLPLAQAPVESFVWIQNTMTLVAAGQPAALPDALRSAVAAVVPDVPLFDTRTLEDRLRETSAAGRFVSMLLAALGVVGLVLSVIGIYGVVAYQAGRRSHEIGLRIALGASARDVLGLLTRQGLRPVVVGFVIGLSAALLLSHALRAALFGVTPTDPVTFVGTAVVLLGAAVLAVLVPARRAIAVDPGRLLAHD